MSSSNSIFDDSILNALQEAEVEVNKISDKNTHTTGGRASSSLEMMGMPQRKHEGTQLTPVASNILLGKKIAPETRAPSLTIAEAVKLAKRPRIVVNNRQGRR